MSKINCDVCGTAYPESASQCPICGCVRSANGPESSDASDRGGSYTYVKGGRFSKSNVRKRNQGKTIPDMPQAQDPEVDEPQEENPKTDKGLVAAVCILLLAVVAVVIYIVMRFFSPDVSTDAGNGNLQVQPSTTESVATTMDSEPTEETELPTVEDTIAPETEETTGETTEATTEETTADTQPAVNYYVEPFSLNTEKRKNDVTIYRSGTFELELRDATGELMEVDWEVVDSTICSVEGNTVKGLKVGKTTVQVTINGTTYSCIVRVKA